MKLLKKRMSRLLSLLTLLLLLLVTVQPASGVVRVSEENRAPEFFAEEAARVWGMPSSGQDSTREAEAYGYEFASDVCEGPNLYGYVGNGPTGATDPLGLAALGNPNYAVAAAILEWGFAGGTGLVAEKAMESIGSTAALVEADSLCMLGSVPSPQITPEDFGWAMIGAGAGQGLAKVAGPAIGNMLGRAAAKKLTPDNIVSNPSLIFGKSVDEITETLSNEGFETVVRQSTKGSKKAIIIEVKRHATISQIQVHPGGGRHGGAYVKISTSHGIIKVVDPKTYIPTPGEKARIINVN